MQPEYRASAEETWDAIAESFDTTRQKPWKFCLDFIRSLKNTDVVADIGCGNGRHLLPCAENCSHAVGVDISQNLLRIVQKKLHNKNIGNVSLIHADVVQLPLADNSLDAVLFIASLHNIQGKRTPSSCITRGRPGAETKWRCIDQCLVSLAGYVLEVFHETIHCSFTGIW